MRVEFSIPHDGRWVIDAQYQGPDDYHPGPYLEDCAAPAAAQVLPQSSGWGGGERYQAQLYLGEEFLLEFTHLPRQAVRDLREALLYAAREWLPNRILRLGRGDCVVYLAGLEQRALWDWVSGLDDALDREPCRAPGRLGEPAPGSTMEVV